MEKSMAFICKTWPHAANPAMTSLFHVRHKWRRSLMRDVRQLCERSERNRSPVRTA